MFQPKDNLQDILEHGEIELQGQFTNSFNYTFLVTVHRKGSQVHAVYKPQRGEQPLWDFPEKSLAGRERCAYLVSQLLGFNLVPQTYIRDGPFGPGMIQQYITHNPGYHYFSFTKADLDRLRPVTLFDLLINNADRKGSHILIQKRTRRIYLIDHGLCFHPEEKLRTVIWNFAGEPIPSELCSALRIFQETLNGSDILVMELKQFLSPDELLSLRSRAEALEKSGFFPIPPEDRRAFPFPPL